MVEKGIKTQRRLLMGKTKSDVERILDKIEGEEKTAKKYKNMLDSVGSKGDKRYFEGKEQALSDLKT
jgi:hypothetical protein